MGPPHLRRARLGVAVATPCHAAIRAVMPMTVRHASGVQATTDGDDVVTLTMSRAELIGLREVIAFLDFLGDLPSRSEGEDRVVDVFLRAADPLIPSLGTDDYGQAL